MFRLKGRELYTAGIATHFVPSENMGQLEATLVQLSQDGASVGVPPYCTQICYANILSQMPV